jgi:hypothetical protein
MNFGINKVIESERKAGFFSCPNRRNHASWQNFFKTKFATKGENKMAPLHENHEYIQNIFFERFAAMTKKSTSKY